MEKSSEEWMQSFLSLSVSEICTEDTDNVGRIVTFVTNPSTPEFESSQPNSVMKDICMAETTTRPG